MNALSGHVFFARTIAIFSDPLGPGGGFIVTSAWHDTARRHLAICSGKFHMWNANYPSPQLFVAGRWVSGSTRPLAQVLNPATGVVLGDLAFASQAQIQDALDASDRAFKAWSQTPAWTRGEILARAGRILTERIETIARWLTLEQGKPLFEARAEVQAAADVFQWVSEECKRTYGRSIPSRMQGLRQIAELEPVGPVALFSPWNFPLVLPTRKVAAALGAGCPCILKPAQPTPASAMAIVLACQEAGVPAGVINLLTGDSQLISDSLIRSPIIRKISLTGSVDVGRQVAALAGAHLKKCTLELGGHAPVIVLDDCDVDFSVSTLVRAKFRNAGQVCVSPTRILVQDSIADAFVEKFCAAASRLVVGDGSEKATEMGPLATARRQSAIEAMIRDAEARGAGILTGGALPNREGFFYPPTVVLDAPATSSAMQEEPFGPVALISRVANLEAAIEEANRLPLGLASYLFTSDLSRARKATAAIKAGMVAINHAVLGMPETPFCGVLDSGYGHEGGVEGIREYLLTKYVSEYSL